jgi:iron-sulfur cluster repair protein YtfE (RIC family)
MKATSLLQTQHQEVRAIFEAIESGDGELGELVEKLADALVAHMAIEQQLFYPAIKSIDEDHVLESYEEHAAAEVALKRVLMTDFLDRSFKAKVSVLKELLFHHLDEEEKELFPKVEQALGAEKLETLGNEMATHYQEVLEEGYEATLKKAAPITTADEARVRSEKAAEKADKKADKKAAGMRPSAPSFA